jgi:hypothetical protein
MATLVSSGFERFHFTSEELAPAMVFTTLQKQWIQTNRAEYAAKVVNKSVDPTLANADLEYHVDVAFNRGAIAVLDYLLATSDQAETELEDLLKALTLKQQTK